MREIKARRVASECSEYKLFYFSSFYYFAFSELITGGGKLEINHNHRLSSFLPGLEGKAAFEHKLNNRL